MKKLSDKELKAEFESSRGQLRLGVTGIVLGGLGIAIFLTLLFDPFKLLGGPPPVHEAKKWIALCICGIWLPGLFGVWFMVIQPLKCGVVIVGGWSKFGNSPLRLVLRSEAPARFRFRILLNCMLLAAVFAIGVGSLRSFIRDLEKARAITPNESLQR
jgi:hypothetical protein